MPYKQTASILLGINGFYPAILLFSYFGSGLDAGQFHHFVNSSR